MANNSSRYLVLAVLAACGTNDLGPGPGPEPVVITGTVSGIVEIDAAVPAATVYLDLNDDNQLDDFEPSTTTDATGHYTLSWDNSIPLQAHTIGAIVSNAGVGYALHMSAPLVGDTSGNFVGTAVISPLSTLVVSEMGNDATLTLDAAKAKIAGALSASTLAVSGDVMADYASTSATSADSAKLGYVAGAIAALVSTTAATLNAKQSLIDCNDAAYFDPAIVAMDKQLTAIADGAVKFSQLTAAQKTDLVQNPGNYVGYFIDTAALTEDIENALLAAAEDFAAYVFDEISAEVAQELSSIAVEVVADQLIDALI
jgi:hypothetical protein